MNTKFLTYFIFKRAFFVCCLTFFCSFSFFAKAQNNIGKQKMRTVVLDAGHGGHDPGTAGRYTKEKNVTLAVALKVGKMISEKFPEIKVIYTRKTDKYIELHERGNIANRNNADLFISFHVDGINNSTSRGASTWVMGLHKTDANMAVSQRENAVITMENNYTSKYEGYDPKSPESFIMFSLLQNSHLEQSIKLAELVQTEMVKNGPIKGNRSVRQAGFLVLWKTAMPSILIEMGFLTNPTEENILANAESQTKIARNIFNAFCKYKTQYEAGSTMIIDEKPISTIETPIELSNNSDDDATESPIETASENIATQKTYSVQIIATPKKLATTASDFKGEKNVRRVKDGKLYKYIVGKTNKLSEAKQMRKRLQKKFKGAFIVEVKGSKLIFVK